MYTYIYIYIYTYKYTYMYIYIYMYMYVLMPSWCVILRAFHLFDVRLTFRYQQISSEEKEHFAF